MTDGKKFNYYEYMILLDRQEKAVDHLIWVHSSIHLGAFLSINDVERKVYLLRKKQKKEKEKYLASRKWVNLPKVREFSLSKQQEINKWLKEK